MIRLPMGLGSSVLFFLLFQKAVCSGVVFDNDDDLGDALFKIIDVCLRIFSYT